MEEQFQYVSHLPLLSWPIHQCIACIWQTVYPKVELFFSRSPPTKMCKAKCLWIRFRCGWFAHLLANTRHSDDWSTHHPMAVCPEMLVLFFAAPNAIGACVQSVLSLFCFLDPKNVRSQNVSWGMNVQLTCIMSRCHCLSSAYSSVSGISKPWWCFMTSHRIVYGTNMMST